MPEPATGDRGPVALAQEARADRLIGAIRCLQQASGTELRLNEPMARHTSLEVGGPAAIYVVPQTVGAVCVALRVAARFDLPLLAVGRGTNLLVLDGGFAGIILHLRESLSAITIEGVRLTAQAGATLAEVCVAAANAGLSGLEFAAGVPGSVGGAVAMNAGARAGQMADVVETVEVVRRNGALSHCARSQLELGYRRSCLRDARCVVVSVTLRLTQSDAVAVREAMFEAVQQRCRRQPLSLGSCGSVFKRPPGDYAGRLLEAAGVKGLRIGGARFSTKHANFIVNEGGATAQDIVELIEMAKRRVYDVCGVKLEEEVCVIGDPLGESE